ncbi:hypothetical protein K1T71_014803 [Dendrolimus kikuchii]|nr:hypothetical protein K1T71_014803 [Dendrolimus kikuchii]
MVQILTGHGCFGKYLHQIVGREPSPSCHECGALQDTAFHTLVECAAWGPQRALLENVVGPVSSLRSMVEAMLQGQHSWLAVTSFCESFMSQKEAAERSREEDAYADPVHRRRTGTHSYRHRGPL